MKKLIFTSVILLILFGMSAMAQTCKPDTMHYCQLTIINLSEKTGYVGEFDFGNGVPAYTIDAGKKFVSYAEVLNYVCNRYNLHVELCLYSNAIKYTYLLRYEPRYK
jgi:hypothetical protein